MEIRTLAELAQEAARFVKRIAPRADGATLVTLAGDVGTGKTAFVQAAAKALGVGELVASPTFVLEKIYQLPLDLARRENAKAFSRLVHIDAYRLEGGAELAPLGFDEIMTDPGNLVMLEWPERVAGGLPEPSARITLTLRADGSRMLHYGG